MEWQLAAMVLGMALVTYLPRVLPLVFLKNMHLSSRWERFFSYIPYAVLGALIFPGVFQSTGNWMSAAVGLLAAILLSWFQLNVVLVVIGAILSVYGVQVYLN
jgi:branched-subunit amino acid transport protein